MRHIAAFNIATEPTLSKEPVIAPTARLRDVSLGVYTEIRHEADVAETTMDDFSYICERSTVIYTDIGKFTGIAASVRVNPGNHPFERPTQHHFTYRPALYGWADSNDEDFFRWRRIQRVTVGHDVWIGHGAVVMPGIAIGNGAIVGSGSVVTRDVAPYTIVAGAPAAPIRKRFPRAVAERIEASAWWHWPCEEIRRHQNLFRDIRAFLAFCDNKAR